MRKSRAARIGLIVAMAGVVCGRAAWSAQAKPSSTTTAPTAVPTSAAAGPFTITSPAFGSGGMIPAPHTCDGTDVSPQLQWTNPPKGTKAFALTVQDPDAPMKTWIHWIVFNMPPDWQGIPQGFPEHAEMANGTQQGKNDFGFHRYGGPCPPLGDKPHHYLFIVYALDDTLALPSQQGQPALIDDVKQAMSGHVLAQAQLVGVYQRKPLTQ